MQKKKLDNKRRNDRSACLVNKQKVEEARPIKRVLARVDTLITRKRRRKL
jgi:hypothetical protein